jgi:serine/threonine protein phosphatase PrpC
MTTIDARCPACDAPLQAGDHFCEQCGTRLDEPGEDRIELDLVTAAAVSDRGRVHRRNEDSFHLRVGGARSVVVVVCDGISSASAGNVAARDAAAAAGAVLDDALADPARDGREAMVRAVEAAGGAVERVPWTTRTGRVDPSCTIVSALCRPEEIVVGWLGDSRAYWLDGDGLRQLTVDDSLAEEGVARGMLTPEQAARSPFLHSITHWVGPDAPARPPRMVALRPEQPGRLIVCTDGLWNYMPTVDELSDLISALPAGATAAATARSLTDTALTRGGRDNITVAVVDIDPSS